MKIIFSVQYELMHFYGYAFMDCVIHKLTNFQHESYYLLENNVNEGGGQWINQDKMSCKTASKG